MIAGKLSLLFHVHNDVQKLTLIASLKRGVLFEDEIPEGLQLIANCMVRRDHQALSFRRIRRMPARRNSVIMNNGKIISQRRIILSSLLRIVVGYLFLSTLFANIAQNDDVIVSREGSL